MAPSLDLNEHRTLQRDPNGSPHNNISMQDADMQGTGEENEDDDPIHLQPQSHPPSQVAPSPNSNELRESPLEANTSTNM